MSQSKVKVAIRIRPLTAKEILQGSNACVSLSNSEGFSDILLSCDDNEGSALVTGSWQGQDPTAGGGYLQTERRFRFGKVYNVTDDQEQVYNQSVRPLVDKFLEGYNATVFVYGQTGSGKTYTMGTDFGSTTNVDDSSTGIIPRSLINIFNYIESHDPALYQFKVTASYLELYNEEFIDLMAPGRDMRSAISCVPRIREDGLGKVSVSNVSVVEAYTVNDLLEMLKKGSICRTTGSTDMNISSSRSHAIFTVTLCQHRPSQSNNSDSSRETVASHLNFVDLAGSERLKKTHAIGGRLREGISINQSLLALGNVICALSDDIKRTGYIPYRDSKLTRLLQDSLGGNSITLMLACISPSSFNFFETLNTLNYANRASNISNKVSINSKLYTQPNFNRATFRMMEKELESLRAMVSVMKSQLLAKNSGSMHSESLSQKSHADQTLCMDVDEKGDNYTSLQHESMGNIVNRSELHIRCSELQRQVIKYQNQVYALRFICSRQDVCLKGLWNDNATNFASTELNYRIYNYKNLPLDAHQSQKEHEIPDDNELFSSTKASLTTSADAISHLSYRLTSLSTVVEWYGNKLGEIARKALPKAQTGGRVSAVALSAAHAVPTSPLSSANPISLPVLSGSTGSRTFSSTPFESSLITDDSALRARRFVLRDLESEKRFNNLRYIVCERAGALSCIEYSENSNKMPEGWCPKDLKTAELCVKHGIHHVIKNNETVALSDEVLNHLSKIEMAIDERQTLANEVNSLGTELDAITRSYNQKIQVLENKLISMRCERDEAIKRLQNLSAPFHAPGSTGLRSLELQNIRLKSELSKCRKKIESSASASREARATTESARVIHLKKSLNSLSLEKSKLLKDVKALKIKKKTLLEQKVDTAGERKFMASRRNRQIGSRGKALAARRAENQVDSALDIHKSTEELQPHSKKHPSAENLDSNDGPKRPRCEVNDSSGCRYDKRQHSENAGSSCEQRIKIAKEEFMKTLFEVVRIKRRQKLLSKIRASRNKLLLRRHELLLERERCLMRSGEQGQDKPSEVDEHEKRISRHVETTQIELAKCEAEMESLSTSGMYRIENKWREVIYTIRELSGHEARAICEQLSIDFVRVLYDLQQNKHRIDSHNFPYSEPLKILPHPEPIPDSIPDNIQTRDQPDKSINDSLAYAGSGDMPKSPYTQNDPGNQERISGRTSEYPHIQNNSDGQEHIPSSTSEYLHIQNNSDGREHTSSSTPEYPHIQNNSDGQEWVSSKIANIALRLRKVIGKVKTDVNDDAALYPSLGDTENGDPDAAMEISELSKPPSTPEESPIYSRVN